MVEKMKKFIEKEALKLKGAHHDYKAEWYADRYLILDKMFMMVAADKNLRPIVTLKLDPEKGEYLRDHYNGQIIPGYYMNKTHWNSVYLDQEFDKKLLKTLITEAYEIILGSFSKKKQEEILLAE